MNQADMLRIAKQSGFKVWVNYGEYDTSQPYIKPTVDGQVLNVELTRFAERVAQHEREALLAWAVSKWKEEVLNRPLINVHRRTLDGTWRQMIRYCGGDAVALIGPSHDDLVEAERERGTK